MWSVESWNSFFELGGVILLFLTFAFGAGFVLTGKKIKVRQEVQLRQFDKDLTDAKRGLVDQQERAANAEKVAAEAKRVAGTFEKDISLANQRAAEANERATKAQASLALAEQHSAEANAKAEGFRLDIAKANETAEKERLARLQLEARLADRVLTAEQHIRLTAALRPFKGRTIDVRVFGDTLEVANFSGAILDCIGEAGLHVNISNPIGGGTSARGILIGVKPGSPPEISGIADVLFSILRESVGGGVGMWEFDKLVFTGGLASVTQSSGGDKVGEAPIRLFIGSK